MIKPYERVLEIGCGTGHSTLALLNNFHKVFAIDMYPECIDKTAELISSIGYKIVHKMEWTGEDATLMCADLFTVPIVQAIMELDVDIIIIWNPGQTDNTKLVKQCAVLAKAKKIPLQVMEREKTRESANDLLVKIAVNNDMRLFKHEVVPAEWNQKEGIKLIGIEGTRVYEAIGLYFPY